MNLILWLACVPFLLWPVLWMIEPTRPARERTAELARAIRNAAAREAARRPRPRPKSTKSMPSIPTLSDYTRN